MKCEDFEASGVVTYVEPQNSKAIHKITQGVIHFRIILMKREVWVATGVVTYVEPICKITKGVIHFRIILMKCEDFEASGVVTYVEPRNSEAIRKIIQNGLRR